MEITDELIDYLAVLSRLSIQDKDRDSLKKDLGEVLNYMAALNQLDTTGVTPMSHVFPVKNVFREDVVTNTADRETLLSNAPAQKDGCFKVPKTVE